MRLLKSIFEFRYKAVPTVLDYRRRIAKIVSGKDLPESLPINDTLGIEIKEQKSKIVVNTHSTSITTEGIEPNKIIDFYLTIFNRLNSILNFDEGIRVGYRNFYLKEVNKDFKSAVELYKSKFFQPIDFIKEAGDVGLALDYNQNGYFIHSSNGPMKQEQLVQQFLEFKHDNLPNDFFFIDVDVSKTNMKINKKTIIDFLTKSDEYKKEIIENFDKLLN